MNSQPNSYASHAEAGIDVMLANWKDEILSLWGPAWWNKAIAFEAVVDFTWATRSAKYLDFVTEMYQTFADFYDQNPQPGYYDDEAWWALAWSRAYEMSV